MSEPLFYQCVVLDNQDPMMLGRVRARLLTDNYLDMVKSFKNPPFNEEKDKWTEKDPFIFNPLLPYFLYQVPKVEEFIYVLYYNNKFKYRNQFYIQAMFSSPVNSPFEYYVGAQKFTGVGVQYTNPKPLKNQDGTFANNSTKGVFPEPGDNGLLGRGNSDVIVKEDGVLIRTNKYKGTLNSQNSPVGNSKNGFLQLSTFGLNKKLVDNKEIIEFDEVVVMVNYLIEYVIINPENTENTFSGYVYLYKLKPDQRVNSKNLTVDSKIDELKSLILIKEFMALSLENTILFINNFINLINSQNTVDGRVIFVPPNKFPIYYRPSNSMYAIISTSPQANSNNKAIENTNNIYKKIQLNATADFKGYGLINSQNQVGFPRRTKKTLENVFKYDNTPTTYGSLGADKIFLLSQKSEIPGKGKINFDGTLYGISNDKYVDDIIPKTSSLVRGEELIELLNLIVRFLLTHTHSFPLLPPLPVGYDGTNSSIILTELQNAYNKILNENIRLN
jgi:hypothetical protein